MAGDYAKDFPTDFPKLKSDFTKRSEVSERYNCVAWAVGECHRHWWPSRDNPDAYWPPILPKDCTLENFIDVFRLFGYEICDNRIRERGFQKIAIFVDEWREPTHAARQLWRGSWVSKIGVGNVDIEHKTLDLLESGIYGTVAQVMKRPWTPKNLLKTFLLSLKVSRGWQRIS